MPQRIKPTDVTAAFRAAKEAARAAGVPGADEWDLRMQGSNFTITSPDDQSGHRPATGMGVYMGGYFAASYREAFDALHAMRRAWDACPRIARFVEDLDTHKRKTGIEVEVSTDKGWTTARALLER